MRVESTSNLVFRGSRAKSIPTLIGFFLICMFVGWFFFHIGQQGAQWGFVITALIACGYIYIFSSFLFGESSLTLSESGFVYKPLKGETVQLSWSEIESVQGYYLLKMTSELLPDGVKIMLKDQYRKKALTGMKDYDYAILGPFKGIFVQDLVGEMNQWFARYGNAPSQDISSVHKQP